jgi:hypothetical protein
VPDFRYDAAVACVGGGTCGKARDLPPSSHIVVADIPLVTWEAVMTWCASPRLSRHAVACAAAFGLMLAAAGAANAFTFQDAPGSANGGQGFTDLDIPKTPNTEGQDPRYNFNNGSTYHSGNTTFQFGGQQGSFQQRYNPSNLFDPYAREGRY